MRKINRVFVVLEIVLTAMFFCTGIYGRKNYIKKSSCKVM